MKEEVLSLLKENHYVSGEEMSLKLGISRTAIWKYINKLKEEGYEFDAIQNKGYKLIKSPDVLTYAEVKPYLQTKYIGREIIHFEEIGSTNDEAKHEASKGCKEGVIVTCEKQVKGKGRMGRAWSTESRTAIAVSIVLKPDMLPNNAPSITPILALSAVEVLRDMTKFDIGIKWPNDIVLNNKKLAGILTEMSAEIDRINYIVIGMGMNINEESFIEEINDVAISLKSFLGRDFNRKEILGKILNIFENYYEEFKKNGLVPFIPKIKEYSVLLGKNVIVKSVNSSFVGEAIGIDNDGSLIVRLENGEIKKVLSGDVSVRGLYGYCD